MLSRLRFILRRIVHTIPVLVGLTIIIFLLVRLLPGDPAIAALGNQVTEQAVAALREQWGLDQPILMQYILFVGRLLRGDLGYSYYYKAPVVELIAANLPLTLFLVAYAVLLTLIISVPLAMLAASRPNGIRDHLVRVVPLGGLGMPHFWIGLVLLLVFSITLRWFPVGGAGLSVVENFRYLFLPSLTLAIGMSPILIRSLRTAMITVLSSDYVGTARTKGLSSSSIFRRHVLRNAFIPAVSVLSVNIGYLIGGSVVIKKVFAIPGLGSLMLNSIFNRDFQMVQSITLVLALLVVCIGIAADIAYVALDPNVDLNRKQR